MAVLRLGELYNDPSKLESTLHPSLISRVRTFSPFFATRAVTLSLSLSSSLFSLSLFHSLLSPGEHSAANVKLFVIVGGVRSFLLSFHVADSTERGKVVSSGKLLRHPVRVLVRSFVWLLADAQWKYEWLQDVEGNRIEWKGEVEVWEDETCIWI